MQYNRKGMMISLIVAMDTNRVIGKDGDMPWHLPDDLKFFKKTTMGHFLLMGRKTFHALRKVLKGRKLLVLTRQTDFHPAEARVVHNIEEGLVYARLKGEDELFIGGGAEIYRQTLPLADRLYITQIDAEFEGDTVFPPFDKAKWRLVDKEHHPVDDRHKYPFDFLMYERIQNK